LKVSKGIFCPSMSQNNKLLYCVVSRGSVVLAEHRWDKLFAWTYKLLSLLHSTASQHRKWQRSSPGCENIREAWFKRGCVSAQQQRVSASKFQFHWDCDMYYFPCEREADGSILSPELLGDSFSVQVPTFRHDHVQAIWYFMPLCSTPYRRVTYTQERYMFHVLIHSGITYLVVAEEVKMVSERMQNDKSYEKAGRLRQLLGNITTWSCLWDILPDASWLFSVTCCALQSFGRRIPFGFLEDIKQRFVTMYGDSSKEVSTLTSDAVVVPIFAIAWFLKAH
jgi:hypothetical protein